MVDAAIVDGTNSLMTFIHARRAEGSWQDQRESNLLDGGVPWYRVYACADGKWVSVAALEQKFWYELLDMLGIKRLDIGERDNKSKWPKIAQQLKEKFATQSRDYWADIFSGSDACVAPVLSTAEARSNAHMVARNAFATEGADQPMPAPRFSDSPTTLPTPAVPAGANSIDILKEAGITESEINDLLSRGVVGTID